MMLRFSASNVIAMIFFIPLIILIGIVLAFLAPLIAVIVASFGILVTSVFVITRLRKVKRQLVQGGERQKARKPIEVRGYKQR